MNPLPTTAAPVRMFCCPLDRATRYCRSTGTVIPRVLAAACLARMAGLATMAP